MVLFNPRSAAELLGRKEAEISWIWEPFIPTGALLVLSAYMKVGKSTLITALMKAVAYGEEFLGHKTTKTPMLLLAVEEHERDVTNRLIAFELREDADAFNAHIGRLPPTAEEYEAIEKFIREKKIGFLVIDTMLHFLDYADENDNAEVRRAVDPLLNLARRYNTAVLLVHHNNKSLDAYGGREIRGASSILGIVDQALILKKHGGADSQRLLQAIGRYEDTPREIIIDLTDDGYVLLGTYDRVTRREVQEKVQKALETGRMTLAELSLATGVKRRKIQLAMNPVPEWVDREGTGANGDPYRYSLNTPTVAEPRAEQSKSAVLERVSTPAPSPPVN